MIPGIFAGRPIAPPHVPQEPFYSGDLINSPGWEPVTWPGAFYDPVTGRTLVAWQLVGAGSHKGARVAAFDHAAGSWTRPHTAGTFTLGNDDHGHPSLVRDADGYIHCFFGSHNNAQKWSVTLAPDDISAWQAMPEISGGEYTYPKPVLVDDEIHLFMRDRLQNMSLVVRKLTPVDGAGSWSAAVNLVNFGSSTRVYTTEPHLVGGLIHFACMYTQLSDTTRRGVYYFIYDPDTGSLSNFDSSVTVPSGSLPVNLAGANADFRIFDHGANDGDVPSLQFDTGGNPHVLFADGTTPTYDLKHMMLDGGTWTSPVTIGSISDHSPSFGYVDTYCLAPGASGSMEAWYNVAGERVRRVRASNGTWSAAEVIATSDNFTFGRGSAVKDPHPSFRVTISETTGSANDTSAALLGLYGHGDSGFVGASIPGSGDPDWDDVSLLVVPGAIGGSSAIDASKSCLPVSFAGSAMVSADAPFAGARSVRTGNGNYFTAARHQAVTTAGTDDFCLDIWFKLDEEPSGRLQVIAAARLSGFSLLVNESGVLQFLMWAGGTLRLNLVGVDAISAGTWYLASVERSGSTATAYLDGAVQATGVQSGDPSLGASDLNFGRDPVQSGRHLDGWICEPRFTRAARYGGASFTPVLAPWPR